MPARFSPDPLPFTILSCLFVRSHALPAADGEHLPAPGIHRRQSHRHDCWRPGCNRLLCRDACASAGSSADGWLPAGERYFHPRGMCSESFLLHAELQRRLQAAGYTDRCRCTIALCEFGAKMGFWRHLDKKRSFAKAGSGQTLKKRRFRRSAWRRLIERPAALQTAAGLQKSSWLLHTVTVSSAPRLPQPSLG